MFEPCETKRRKRNMSLDERMHIPTDRPGRRVGMFVLHYWQSTGVVGGLTRKRPLDYG